jgi:hypothetical protein
MPVTPPGKGQHAACQNARLSQLAAARPLDIDPRDVAHLMDIERINAIGTLLADLVARTEQLRGYL